MVVVSWRALSYHADKEGVLCFAGPQRSTMCRKCSAYEVPVKKSLLKDIDESKGQKKRQTRREKIPFQPENNRGVLLPKKRVLEQKRETGSQVSTEESYLDKLKEKANNFEQESAHLQENSHEIHLHCEKDFHLRQKLKVAHFQLRKDKKGTFSDEKTELTHWPKNKKKEACWQQEQKGKEQNKRRHMQKFMWLKTRHSMCLPKPTAVCCGVQPRISSPSPPVQGYVATAGEDDNLKVWLKSRGEDEACSTLVIGKSSHGRGLFASRPILAGECILRISRKLVITPDKLHDELNDLLQESVSNCARLALLILSEQYAGEASEWAPYLNCLPQFGTLHNTVLWNDDELELLRPSSSAYRQSLWSRTTICGEFSAVQHVLQQCPHLFGQSVTCSEFLHAYAVVNSRAWGLDEGNTVGLVPFVDFLNHNTSCQSFLSFDKDYKYAEVLADRDYSSGEQVFINYGNYGNDVLAATFGFTVEFNPYDQVEVWMGLSKKDTLRKLRLELLESHGMHMLSRFGGPDDGGNFFLIKEVKAIKGRGKGIPQPLRAFARVLCADSEKELIDMARRASQLDGRLAREPLKDVQKELQAMVLLLDRLETLIKEHVAAILALEMAYFCKVDKESVPCIRRRMAKDILDGEVCILRSAANWLKHHCIALKSLL